MLSGLVCEATWFADRVGDWKTAYQLSVAHLLHKHVVPSVYERLRNAYASMLSLGRGG